MKGRVVYGRKLQYFIDDKPVSKAEFNRAFPTKIDDLLKKQEPPATLMQTSSAWPRNSEALGVHPKQVKDAQAQAARLGVPTEFTKDGRAILRNSAHQRDLQKALGVHNRDGGYGQVTG